MAQTIRRGLRAVILLVVALTADAFAAYLALVPYSVRVPFRTIDCGTLAAHPYNGRVTDPCHYTSRGLLVGILIIGPVTIGLVVLARRQIRRRTSG